MLRMKDGTPITGTTLDMLRERGDSLSLSAADKIVALREDVERLKKELRMYDEDWQCGCTMWNSDVNRSCWRCGGERER
jgi:hypothetical protein